MTLPRPASRLAPAVLAALLPWLAGCQTRILLPVAPKPDTPPRAATPADALRRLAWSWKHRALEPCRDLFSCDYEFAFAPEDTSGRRFLDRPWTRPDELDFARHLFETGGAQGGPASYVALDLQDDPPALPDDRPGKNARCHQRIETPFVAVVVTPGRELRLLGIERLYFVRGDSACIPQELRDRGYGPDSTRWWIERWEDYSTTAAPFRAQPARPVTVGAVKALYLDAPPAP
ncbi:MAG TPA: hypothetical protein VGK89_11225 [Candidatus Eisenbacteria bacterium]